MTGIYAIYSDVNDTYYIGQSVNIPRRISGHKHSLEVGNHKNLHLQRAWDKYGEDRFVFEPLFKCEQEKLTQYEQLLCDTAKKYGLNLYNKRICVDSNAGVPLDEEHRKKIGQGRKGKFRFSIERPEKCPRCGCTIIGSIGIRWYCTECKKNWLKEPKREKVISRPSRCPLCKNKIIISAGSSWMCKSCKTRWLKVSCPDCESYDIRSNGDRFKCRSCGRTWNKKTKRMRIGL